MSEVSSLNSQFLAQNGHWNSQNWMIILSHSAHSLSPGEPRAFQLRPWRLRQERRLANCSGAAVPNGRAPGAATELPSLAFLPWVEPCWSWVSIQKSIFQAIFLSLSYPYHSNAWFPWCSMKFLQFKTCFFPCSKPGGQGHDLLQQCHEGLWKLVLGLVFVELERFRLGVGATGHDWAICRYSK